MSNLDLVKAAVEAGKPLHKEYYELQRVADAKMQEILGLVEALKLDPEDKDDEEEIIEIITDLGSLFGQEWEGHWNVGGYWDVGDEIQYWEPSTC